MAKKKDKPLAYSYSKLRKYNECPRAWYIIYVQGRQQVMAPPLLLGGVVHEATAFYDTVCWKKKVTHSLGDWRACTKKAIGLSSPPLTSELEEEVYQLMESYVSYHELDLKGLIGIEERIAFNSSLDETGWVADDVWFRLILDRLWIKKHMALIRDVKTSNEMKADTFQIECYSWAVLIQYPQVQEVYCDFDFIRFEHITDPVVYTRDQLPMLHDKIIARVAQIAEDTKWKPRIGDHCRRCGVRNYCPAMKAGAKPVRYPFPKNQKEIDKVVEDYSVAKTIASDAYDAIKDYADAVGDFNSKGRAYKWSSTVSWTKVDPTALFEALETLGIEPLLFFKPDMAALRDLALENEQVLMILDRIGQKKLATRLSDTIEKVKLPK